MEDSSNVGGIVENYQVIPAINKLDENYFEPDFYPPNEGGPAFNGEPAYESGDATDIGEGLGEYDTAGGGSYDDFLEASGEPAYESGDATAIGEGLGEYETAGGGSYDQSDEFMSELGETDEAFSNAFGDGLRRFGQKLRSDSKKRQAKRKRKRRLQKRKRARGGPRGYAGDPPRRGRGPRRGPPPRRRRPRGPVGGNAPRPGVSQDVREMDATITKFASEPIANADGKYGNGYGEWKTAGGGSYGEYSNAPGKGEGISTTAKVAIAVGAAALVGTILFFVVRARRKR